MEIIPIEYRHLYINNLSNSGGPIKSIGNESYPCKTDGFYYCITYEFDGQRRELWRRSSRFVPIGDFILAHENYLEFYKAYDPEEGIIPDKLIQYDSVYNITHNHNGGGSIYMQDTSSRHIFSGEFWN